ncbi:hypothetical protein BH24ACT26_BH24ACT26_17080 [soil metagenome]
MLRRLLSRVLRRLIPHPGSARAPKHRASMHRASKQRGPEQAVGRAGLAPAPPPAPSAVRVVPPPPPPPRAAIPPLPPPPAPRRVAGPVRVVFEDGTEVSISDDPVLERRVAHVLQAILPPRPPGGAPL